LIYYYDISWLHLHLRLHLLQYRLLLKLSWLLLELRLLEVHSIIIIFNVLLLRLLVLLGHHIKSLWHDLIGAYHLGLLRRKKTLTLCILYFFKKKLLK